MARADFRYFERIRVRYAEIDGQSVVFNSRYLEYADVGITEYWRAVGVRDHPEWQATEFHVARAVVEFRAPIKLDEEIDILCRTTRIGRSSLTNVIEIHGTAAAPVDDLRAEIELVNVNVDLTTGKSVALPSWMTEMLAGFDAA